MSDIEITHKMLIDSNRHGETEAQCYKMTTPSGDHLGISLKHDGDCIFVCIDQFMAIHDFVKEEYDRLMGKE